MSLFKHIAMLLVFLGAFSFNSFTQVCEGFHMSGIKCKRPSVEQKHCILHGFQQHHYCRFTKTVAKGIMNRNLRVDEFDIQGLSKKQAENIAETIKIQSIDTVDITNNGLELAFGNFREVKKMYLKHIDILPVQGKAGHIMLKMTYARKEKWW